MASRKFHCSLSALLGAARHLADALIDPDYAAALAERLDAKGDKPTNNFVTRFEAKLTALGVDDSGQKTQAGHAGTLTRSQKTAFGEMERLVAGARRSARLAFPANPVKLHSEFQVGISDPSTLDAELERAQIILASSRNIDNAVALKEQGWLGKDTDALEAAVGQFADVNLAKTGAVDDRIGLTSQKIAAANAVYSDILRIQNAARLEYPSTKPGMEAARKRFLLDEFPPRDRSEPSGGTQAPTTPSVPPKL